LTLVGPEGSTPATLGADQSIRVSGVSGEQGGKLVVDRHGNAVAMVVDRQKDQLIIVPAAALLALRDVAVREANAGRATPFSPGSVQP
jgi:hypothetical protein